MILGSCEESCGYQESVKVRDLIQKIKEDFEEEGAVFEDVVRTILNSSI